MKLDSGLNIDHFAVSQLCLASGFFPQTLSHFYTLARRLLAMSYGSVIHFINPVYRCLPFVYCYDLKTCL